MVGFIYVYLLNPMDATFHPPRHPQLTLPQAWKHTCPLEPFTDSGDSYEVLTNEDIQKDPLPRQPVLAVCLWEPKNLMSKVFQILYFKKGMVAWWIEVYVGDFIKYQINDSTIKKKPSSIS